MPAGVLEDGFKTGLLILPGEAPPLQDPGMCAVGQMVPESSDLQPFSPRIVKSSCSVRRLVSSQFQLTGYSPSLVQSLGSLAGLPSLCPKDKEWKSDIELSASALRTCPSLCTSFSQFSCKVKMPSLGCPRLPICHSRQSTCLKGSGAEKNRNPNDVRINSNQVLRSMGWYGSCYPLGWKGTLLFWLF